MDNRAKTSYNVSRIVSAYANLTGVVRHRERRMKLKQM